MRMVRLLDETIIQGITTNKDLLIKLLKNEKFREGNGDTSLVKEVLTV
jgi:biotin carboxylase